MKLFTKLFLMVALALGTAEVAQALRITDASIVGGQVCSDSSCTTVLANFSTSVPNLGSGQITLINNTLTFTNLLVGNSRYPNTANGGTTDLTAHVFNGTAMTSSLGADHVILSGGGTSNGFLNDTQFPLLMQGGTCTELLGGDLTCALDVSFESFGKFFFVTIDLAAVPEPGLAVLCGMALLLFAWRRS